MPIALTSTSFGQLDTVALLVGNSQQSELNPTGVKEAGQDRTVQAARPNGQNVARGSTHRQASVVPISWFLQIPDVVAHGEEGSGCELPFLLTFDGSMHAARGRPRV